MPCASSTHSRHRCQSLTVVLPHGVCWQDVCISQGYWHRCRAYIQYCVPWRTYDAVHGSQHIAWKVRRRERQEWTPNLSSCALSLSVRQPRAECRVVRQGYAERKPCSLSAGSVRTAMTAYCFPLSGHVVSLSLSRQEEHQSEQIPHTHCSATCLLLVSVPCGCHIQPLYVGNTSRWVPRHSRALSA